MRRRVRVSLVGEFGVGNYGNEACLEHEIGVLRTAGGVDISVLCNIPEAVTAQHGVAARPVVAPVRHPRSFVGRVTAKVLDVGWLGWLVLRSDVLVVPGTGIFETQWAVPGEIPFVLFMLAVWSVLFRRPLLALSVGADLQGSPLARWFSTTALRLSSLVTARDDASAAAIAERTGHMPSIVPDLVLGETARSTEHRVGVVGLGLLDYPGASGYRRPDQRTRDEYVSRVRDLVVRLGDLGKQVVVLRGDAADGSILDGLELEERVARGEVRVSSARTLAEVAGEVAGVEVLVASRYHNLLVAARAGTPMIGIGYGRTKQREMMRLAGLEDYFWPIADFDPERVAAQVKELADAPTLGDEVAARAREAAEAVRVQDDWLLRGLELGRLRHGRRFLRPGATIRA